MELINREFADGKYNIQETKQKVEYTESSKITNLATLMIQDEDHTLGNIVR